MSLALLSQKGLFSQRITNKNQVTWMPQYLPACVLKYFIE